LGKPLRLSQLSEVSTDQLTHVHIRKLRSLHTIGFISYNMYLPFIPSARAPQHLEHDKASISERIPLRAVHHHLFCV
jgi:hypothetical protein